MNTILRPSYVFGPVNSRRLGNSLGINVLPIEKKLCNFNCIYCECGWNEHSINAKFPPRKEIKDQLIDTLIKYTGDKLDTITFSGNGEPTLHPDFSGIIDDTIEVRNQYYHTAKISVLSNSTNLLKPAVLQALLKIDNPILKLDSANIETLNKINLPVNHIELDEVIDGMLQFNGNFVFQTMFLRNNDRSIDNTTNEGIEALLGIMKRTNPRQVMIYPIDRETPANDLVKLAKDEMQVIAQKIKDAGLNVMYV